MVRKIIIANWKMNPPSLKEAEKLLSGITNYTKDSKNAKIIICPPFPYLSIIKRNKDKKITLGAQNFSVEFTSSYTGEVSCLMLKNMGVKYVIIGHSERRFLGESDEVINKKILMALKLKLFPILCIGEDTRDKEGKYLVFIKNQIEKCLHSVPKSEIKNVIIAYEPIWAVGEKSFREATPEEFMEVKIFIKKIISDIYDVKTANIISILYGGSVNPVNVQTFIKKENVDGFLVGRASLDSKSFSSIIRNIK